MHVVYTGPLDAVEIAATATIAPRGETVEVDDALGESLIQQSCWEQVKPKPAAKSAEKKEG